MLHSYDVGKLDVSRIYRYLNKYFGIENIETAESCLVAKMSNDNDDDSTDESMN
jgi:hypothetical protein